MGVPISALRDNFDDASIGSAWTTIVLGSASVNEVGTTARCALPSSIAGSHSAFFRTPAAYDLTAGSVYLNIAAMVSTSVAASFFFDAFGAGNNILRWTQTSTTLKAQTVLAGVTTDQFSVTWNATTHKYLRIRHSGSNVLFDSSTDGLSWTNRATVAAPFPVIALQVQFGASCGNVAAPGTLQIEEVNLILPALTTNWRWVQCVWPFTERNKTDTLALDTAGTAQGYLVTADGVDVNGDPSGNIRYWSGPADGGRLLTEQASDAAAKAMAVDIPVDGRFDLPTVIEGRCYRLYCRSIDGSAFTLREFYPRRLVQADDIEAESIRALHIAAASITGDRIVAGTITADLISVVNLQAISAQMGDLHMDGVIDIAAAGGIYQGSGTFASPTTGLKLYNSGGIGRLAGYNATVEQAVFDTDGKLKAGAGAVILDDQGISIPISGAAGYLDPHAYKFTDGTSVIGKVQMQWLASNYQFLQIKVPQITGRVSQVDITADSPTAKVTAVVGIYAMVNAVSKAAITITGSTTAAASIITMDGDSVAVSGGLNVGAVSGAGVGQIKTSGNVAIATAIAAATRMLINGTGTTNTTFGLVVRDSGSTNNFYVQDDGVVVVRTSITVGASQVVGTRRTGWAVPTGTFTRTTYATSTVTLPQLAERVAALIQDLHATAGHGMIGT